MLSSNLIWIRLDNLVRLIDYVNMETQVTRLWINPILTMPLEMPAPADMLPLQSTKEPARPS